MIWSARRVSGAVASRPDIAAGQGHSASLCSRRPNCYRLCHRRNSDKTRGVRVRLGRSVMGPTLDRIYQLSGVIALTPSTSYDILHTSFGSDWRGAFLIHSRHAGAEFEGTWSKLRITRRLSLSGGPLPSCIGGPASPPEAMLQVGIPGATYRQMPPNRMEKISLLRQIGTWSTASSARVCPTL